MKARRDPSREFAFVFAVIAALVGLAPLLHGGSARFAPLGATAVLVAIGLFTPRLVSAPAHAWLSLGGLLNRVTSALVLAIIYLAVITPMGIYRRFRKGDQLQRRFDSGAPTYWTDREEPNPTVGTLPRQY